MEGLGSSDAKVAEMLLASGHQTLKGRAWKEREAMALLWVFFSASPGDAPSSEIYSKLIKQLHTQWQQAGLEGAEPQLAVALKLIGEGQKQQFSPSEQTTITEGKSSPEQEESILKKEEKRAGKSEDLISPETEKEETKVGKQDSPTVSPQDEKDRREGGTEERDRDTVESGKEGETGQDPESKAKEESASQELGRMAQNLRQAGLQGGQDHEKKAMDFIRRMQELAKKKASSSPSEPIPWRRDPKEEYFVDNAGIVLMWPFLSRYFSYCGLLEGGDFVDERARERAVHLLQFLATGKEEPEPEYNLVLNKLLCGFDPEAPIGMDFRITDKEKEQGEQVLLALIGYWDKLKSTSIEGLRGTFFLREGSIRSKDSGWLIKIARKPYDILLDYLPFGIGTIKLSYLDTMIFTEW